jgi:hypothetical protein
MLPNPAGEKFCFSSEGFRPPLESTQPPVATGGALSSEVKWSGLEVAHSCLSPVLRMCGVMPPFSHIPSWRAQGQRCYSFTVSVFFLLARSCKIIIRLHFSGGGAWGASYIQICQFFLDKHAAFVFRVKEAPNFRRL